jgi:hypothetical protein
MLPFRSAVESGDHSLLSNLLAPNVTFLSPVAYAPYKGRDLVAAILRGAGRVFEDFRYERELVGEEGRAHALVFRARIGERDIQGCDFLHLDADGLIDEFSVMVRPLSAAHALSEAMARQFEIVKRELGLPS